MRSFNLMLFQFVDQYNHILHFPIMILDQKYLAITFIYIVISRITGQTLLVGSIYNQLETHIERPYLVSRDTLLIEAAPSAYYVIIALHSPISLVNALLLIVQE